jgi:hypothetical protein
VAGRVECSEPLVELEADDGCWRAHSVSSIPSNSGLKRKRKSSSSKIRSRKSPHASSSLSLSRSSRSTCAWRMSANTASSSATQASATSPGWPSFQPTTETLVAQSGANRPS